LFEDGAAMLGLLVALAGIALAQVTGNPVFDGLASMGIGLILAGTAFWLAYETKSLLIGEAASSWLVEDIRDLLGAQSDIKTVNEVATLHMGPDFVLAAISVDFADDMSADDLENRVTELTGLIKQIDPSLRRVFIEAERRIDHGKARVADMLAHAPRT